MADVFLSYASDDRARVAPIHEALLRRGYTVWWDRSLLAGQAFGDEIERELKQAAAVVVVWSAAALRSHWVQGEADLGASRGVLVPVRLDDLAPPIPHRLRHTLDFSAWQGDPAAACMAELDAALRSHRLRSFDALARAVQARAEGRRSAARALTELVAAGGAGAAYARYELAMHEFARAGDARAPALLLPLLQADGPPGVARAIAALVALCHLARDRADQAAAVMAAQAPLADGLRWPSAALVEVLVQGGLARADDAARAWAALRTPPPSEADAYAQPVAAREHARALLAVVYGQTPVDQLCKALVPDGALPMNGLVHFSAALSRAVRKASPVLAELQARALADGWKQRLEPRDVRRRCREFERRLMPTAGTLFPATGGSPTMQASP